MLLLTQIKIKHFVPISYSISHLMILSKRIGRIQKQLEHVSLIDTRNEIFLLTYSDNVYIKIGFYRNNGVLHRITRMCLRQKKDNTEITDFNDWWIFDLTVFAYVFLTLYELLFYKDLLLLSKHWNFWLCMATIAHFTVTVANEAGVDLVLIQPFLLYYAKLVVVMLTSIF